MTGRLILNKLTDGHVDQWLPKCGAGPRRGFRANAGRAQRNEYIKILVFFFIVSK